MGSFQPCVHFSLLSPKKKKQGLVLLLYSVFPFSSRMWLVTCSYVPDRRFAPFLLRRFKILILYIQVLSYLKGRNDQ